MEDVGVWFRLVLAVLAAWRVSHLLAHEDGPADLLIRWRRWLGDSIVGRLMDCFYCLSLWVAVPLTFFVTEGVVNRLVAWLAISGGACLLEKWTGEPGAPHPLPGTLDGTEESAWDAVDRNAPR